MASTRSSRPSSGRGKFFSCCLRSLFRYSSGLCSGPQRSQERTHFCSWKVTHRARMSLRSTDGISRGFANFEKAFLCSIEGTIPPSRPAFHETWPQPAVKDGRRPPLFAARSVLDGRLRPGQAWSGGGVRHGPAGGPGFTGRSSSLNHPCSRVAANWLTMSLAGPDYAMMDRRCGW